MSSVNTSLCGIYAIYSAVNGRTYIGHSVNIKSRWKSHRSDLRRGVHRNPHLQNAWNKYGPEAFEFSILEECLVEALLEREQFHMDQYSDKYNLAPVAGSLLGYKHTPEARANMSSAMMGNTNSLGRIQSAETRAKMSSAQMGHTKWLGRKHSDETRAKMSAARKAYWERKRTTEPFSSPSP